MKNTFTLLLSLLFIFGSLNSSAQKKEAKQGGIKVKGGTYYLDAKGKKVAVPEANIIVYTTGKTTEKLAEYQSNKKGLYEFSLDYGPDYKIAFENNIGYIYECFLIESSKVPPAKHDTKATIEMDGVLIPDTQADVDTLKFRFPYTKLKFDGDKKFVDDPRYLQEFMKGIFKEYKAEKARIKKEAVSKTENAKAEAGKRYRKITGKLYSGTPASKPERNIKLNLVDEGGKVIESTTTSKLGHFSFSKIDASKNYTIQSEASDTSSIKNGTITIYNKYGNEITSMTANEKGAFTFKLLNTDQKTFALMQVEDIGLTMSGSITGQMKEGDTEVPVTNTLVVLVNNKGQIIDKATTDERGNFVFLKLPPDQNVMVRVEELDPAYKGMHKAFLKNPSGKTIANKENGGLNTFQFNFLAGEQSKINDMITEDGTMTISGSFTGQLKDGSSKPLKNTKITLVNSKGEEVETGTTDDNGGFSFKNLPADQNFYVQIEEIDPIYKGLTKVILKDEKGTVKASLENDGSNTFKFTFLSQSENYINDLLVDETKITTTMKGKLQTGENSTAFATIKVDLHGSDGNLLKSTQTDAEGNFAFKGLKLQLGYYILLDAGNSQVASAKNLLLANSKGKVYKEYGLNEGGDNKIHLLISDMMHLATFNLKSK